MAELRNIPTDRGINLASSIEAKKNQVVSMALSRSETVDISVLAFSENENISEESYFGDTMYFVLEGKVSVREGDKVIPLETGDATMVKAHTLHAIEGKGSYKFMQITLY